MSNSIQYPGKFMLRQELEAKGFTYLGSGRHRRSFLCPSNKYVLKVPKNANGELANEQEVRIYRKSLVKPCDIKFARCRQFFWKDFLCNIMEYVQPLRNYEVDKLHHVGELPDWVWAIDCEQVGYNARGEVVAYDYSNI